MQEVKIKNNELGIPIYFADTPDFSKIPDSTINLLMQDLEFEITACVEKKLARKKYRDNKKKNGNSSDDTRPP